MFNRMNLTLSALAHSNRLNLGTRSLARNAGVNHGDQTLRTRHTHFGVMREGMGWYDVFPITQPGYGLPTFPGSLFQQQPNPPSCLRGQPGWSAVDVFVEPEPRPDNLVGRLERCVEDGGDPRFQTVAPTERRSPRREIGSKSRSGLKSPGKPVLKRAARRAARHAAAAPAAAVGK
jgi:hypothetical protein